MARRMRFAWSFNPHEDDWQGSMKAAADRATIAKYLRVRHAKRSRLQLIMRGDARLAPPGGYYDPGYHYLYEENDRAQA